MNPAVTAVVVSYRQAALAAACVASIRRGLDAEGIEGQIVLVDCGSGEAERAALEAIPAELCLLADNRGYSGGVNAGLARARAGRLLLTNADVELRPGALSALLSALDDPRAGAVAPVCSWDAQDRVFLPPGFDPGFLQELAMHGGGSAGGRADRRFARFAREAVALWTGGGTARHLSGAVLAARRDVFDRVGRFDEGFRFEYEETEWERRVRAEGLELRVVGEARARHLWGASAAGNPETERRRAESKRLYRQRRYGRLGRALLERAEGNGAPRTRADGRPCAAAAPVRRDVELPAMPGHWVALSPHASRYPFAGAELSRPFRVPAEIRAAAPAGDWYWTVFASDGEPLETFAAELA